MFEIDESNINAIYDKLSRDGYISKWLVEGEPSLSLTDNGKEEAWKRFKSLPVEDRILIGLVIGNYAIDLHTDGQVVDEGGVEFL